MEAEKKRSSKTAGEIAGFGRRVGREFTPTRTQMMGRSERRQTILENSVRSIEHLAVYTDSRGADQLGMQLANELPLPCAHEVTACTIRVATVEFLGREPNGGVLFCILVGGGLQKEVGSCFNLLSSSTSASSGVFQHFTRNTKTFSTFSSSSFNFRTAVRCPNGQYNSSELHIEGGPIFLLP